MKSKLLFCLALLCLLQSCKKTDTVVPPPVLPPVTPPPVSPPVTPPVTTPFVEMLGAGWSKQFLSTSIRTEDIFFNSTTSGYAIADGLYKTINGGTTWSRLNVIGDYFNMFTTTDEKVFILRPNAIVKTLDGGLTFSQLSLGSALMQDIFFTDNSTGYCTTSDGLYTTINSGTSWTKISTTGLIIEPSRYATMFLRGNGVGWISSAKSIYKAAGSYVSWQKSLLTNTPTGYFTGINSSSANIIYAVTDSNEIFKSTDAGSNFSRIAKMPGADFNDVHFISDNVGYNSQGNYIYKTTDGGLTWSIVVATRQKLSELHFVDATHGWAAGDSGMVLTYKL